MFEKIVDKILTTITEPLMLFSLCMIGGLFFIIWFILKNVVNKSLSDLFVGQKEQAMHLAEYNKIQAVTITLIEGMVYGKEGKTHERIS
jgi:hypothetical protein